MDGDSIIEQVIQHAEFKLSASYNQITPSADSNPTSGRSPSKEPIGIDGKLRLSAQALIHGFPPGLAKSARWHRDELMASYREKHSTDSDEAREIQSHVHVALAWSLDAERFLGSFNHSGRDPFPPEAVDAVVEQMLAWLESMGFQVVPNDH